MRTERWHIQYCAEFGYARWRISMWNEENVILLNSNIPDNNISINRVSVISCCHIWHTQKYTAFCTIFPIVVSSFCVLQSSGWAKYVFTNDFSGSKATSRSHLAKIVCGARKRNRGNRYPQIYDNCHFAPRWHFLYAIFAQVQIRLKPLLLPLHQKSHPSIEKQDASKLHLVSNCLELEIWKDYKSHEKLERWSSKTAYYYSWNFKLWKERVIVPHIFVWKISMLNHIHLPIRKQRSPQTSSKGYKKWTMIERVVRKNGDWWENSCGSFHNKVLQYILDNYSSCPVKCTRSCTRRSKI